MKTTMRAMAAAAALAFTGIGCASTAGTQKAQQTHPPVAQVADVTDAAEQKAMSPADALAALKEGNARFVAGQSRVNAYEAQRTTTAAEGQYPFATILSCIDSRSVPEAVFDLRLGDAFAPRVAGNFVTEELLGSMEFATKVAGSKVLVVMGHTQCGAVKGACDGVRLGNLTSVIKAIEPSVERVQGIEGERSSKNEAFVHAVTVDNVRRNLEELRARSPILAEMERAGELKIVGALHDLSSGEVTWIE